MPTAVSRAARTTGPSASDGIRSVGAGSVRAEATGAERWLRIGPPMTSHPVTSSHEFAAPTSIGLPAARDGSGPVYPDISAIGTAEQPIGFPPLTFGRTTGTAITARHGREDLPRRRWRAAIDQALGGDRSTHAFGDDALDDHDTFDTAGSDTDLVPGMYELSRFRRGTVDANMPAPAGRRGGGAGLEQPYSPRPGIDAGLCGNIRNGFGSGHFYTIRRAVTTSSGERLV